MKFILRSALVLLTSLSLNALYALGESDFQYKAKLDAPGSHPVYKSIIPFQVYQGIQRSDLGDIRVLNADGVELPHAIRNFKIRRSILRKSMRLPIFPIQKSETKTDGDLSIIIRKSSSGTLVKINSIKQNNQKSSTTTMVIIDASKLKYNINSLTFDWSSNSKGSIQTLIIEKSSDLKIWHYVKNGTITRLKYLDHQLDRNIIRLPGLRALYLRIRWKNSDDGFSIKSIRAQYYNIKTDKPITPRIHTVIANRVAAPKNDPNSVYYKADIGALPPIDEIELKLPYDNMAVNGKLLTRNVNWEYDYRRKKRFKSVNFSVVWSGLLYSIKTKNGQITNKNVRARLQGKKTFYIRLPKSAIPAKLKQLMIKIHWTPHKLLFIAQGSRPYTLVYGSTKVEPSRFNFETLAQLMKTTHGKTFRPGFAKISAIQKINSFKKTTVNSDEPQDSTRWILWSILLLGVIFLGVMTRKIAKQISENK